MTRPHSWLSSAIFALVLLSATGALAQVIPNSKWLSEDERAAYREQLADAEDSANRAKILAEINNITQTRMLEQRRAERAAKRAIPNLAPTPMRKP